MKTFIVPPAYTSNPHFSGVLASQESKGSGQEAEGADEEVQAGQGGKDSPDHLRNSVITDNYLQYMCVGRCV